MNDVIFCSHKPQLIFVVLTLAYDLKDRVVGPSMIYLVSNINKYHVNSCKCHWSIPIKQCVNNSIKVVKGLLKDEDIQLREVKSTEKQPLPNG